MRCRKEIVEADEGKVETGVAHVGPGEGSKSLRVFGETVTYKVTSDRTGGAYSLFEVETPPGRGPPPHVQHREDEVFWVLEGVYKFHVEGRTLSAGEGSLIYVPKGNLHVHTNVGEKPGRMLVSQTPGGLHERFFEEVGEMSGDTSTPLLSENLPDRGRIARIAAGYGIEMPSLGRSPIGQEGITE